MNRLIIGAAGFVLSLTALSPVSAQTLDAVKKKGYLQCGVTTGLPGFSNPDDKGVWKGLDVDFCRALAAAIFDKPDAVRFTPLTAKDRFEALKSGEIDILSRNTTWSMSRDTQLGFNFIGVNYYDGQGFMVRKALNLASAKQLDGASICTQTGTTNELNAGDFFRQNNLKYEIKAFAGQEEALKTYEAGGCEAFTSDASQLYALRLKLVNAADHIVLPEVISKEPLGPLVRHGDDQWFDLAKWTLYAMINAEELGVNSGNVEEMAKTSTNPEVRRLLGAEGDFGTPIGLSKDWVVRIVKAVGNYGESFERNVGQGSLLKIARGQNDLWTRGGLQYGIPIR